MGIGLGIVSKLMDVIIKSTVSNTVENELSKELIGALVEGVSDRGINWINDLINDSKFKIDYALSEDKMRSMLIPEDHFRYIVTEIKELLSSTEITDKTLMKCNYDAAKLKDVLLEEYCKKNKYIEYESDIKKVLYNIAEVLISIECESDEFEQRLLLQIGNSADKANVGLQNISAYMKENFEKLNANSQSILEILWMAFKQNEDTAVQIVEYLNNKKQDYIDNWNGRLFLHLDNDKRPLTLGDVFIMPHYDDHNKESMRIVIHKFIRYDGTANMLITGVPGIGKTSIVSWIAYTYEKNNDVIILRFRDWDRNELDNGLFRAICNTLDCVKRDLENKIIILDGYDEIKNLDNGKILIRDFLNDILDFRNLKIIVTSRTDYIESYLFQYQYMLLPFEIDEIKQFYYSIKKEELISEIDQRNLDVLGIPVILYMAIMSDIDLTLKTTKPELYSKVFAKKGGIFDKFSYSGKGYDYGNQILRDPNNINIYLGFLQKVAYMMFDEDKLSLPRNENIIPRLFFQGEAISVLEFPIKHLFENKMYNFEFVHKSIYEYFVSEYIIEQMREVISSDNFKEKLAGFFGRILKGNKLTLEIIEFMKYKIKNNEPTDNFREVYESFQVMIQDGMTFYSQIQYRNIIKCISNIFKNMLDILHLWEDDFIIFDNLFIEYLKLDIEDLDLSKCNLYGVNLQRIGLKRANLTEANLRGADLRRADLTEADLRGADLTDLKLEGACLLKTIFDEKQITYLRDKYDLQKSRVFIDKTNEMISYKEFIALESNCSL